jgi:hypothetical protein
MEINRKAFGHLCPIGKEKSEKGDAGILGGFNTRRED